ncbi:MAG: radical SAM protein [Thermotogae bacterium]|nr:MAG: radical SAM protein [Thermotogota bacterium]
MPIMPVFLPQVGCRQRCIFCDQTSVTGVLNPPSIQELEHKARQYEAQGRFEIAFYGGSFSGLAYERQLMYLKWAKKWFDSGKVSCVRISTRPDMISENSVQILHLHGVRIIEIGAQSFDEEVLRLANRGHTPADVEKAVRIAKKFGMKVGIHLMVGLPGDSPDKDMFSAHEVIRLKADLCRIHPTIILKNSLLAEHYRNGNYHPIDLETAVDIVSEMFIILQSRGVLVNRIGLYVPPDLTQNIVAGPYSPRFGELVKIQAMQKIIDFLSPSKVIFTDKEWNWIRQLNNRSIAKIELLKGDNFRIITSSASLTLEKAFLEYALQEVQ